MKEQKERFYEYFHREEAVVHSNLEKGWMPDEK